MSGRRKTLASLITLLALVGLGVSGYLTWVTWSSGSVVGCMANAVIDCEDVLTSRWSKWFGQPVSMLGAVTYFLILLLCWPAASRGGWAASALFAAALGALGAAAWFVGLQAIELQSYCLYCLSVHVCSLFVCGLSFWLFIDRSGVNEPSAQPLFGADKSFHADDDFEFGRSFTVAQLLVALLVSALGLSTLMAGQFLADPSQEVAFGELELQPLDADAAKSDSAANIEQAPTENPTTTDSIETDNPSEADSSLADTSSTDTNATDAEGGSTENSTNEQTNQPAVRPTTFVKRPRWIAYQALPTEVDVRTLPTLGNPNAEHVVIEMMDYTCHHCRHLHPHVEAMLEQFDGQVAIAIQHVPLSKKCNPHIKSDYPGKQYACDYAQLAIGVWQRKPAKFLEFHRFLMEGEKPPTISKARTEAMKIAGMEVLIDKRAVADATSQIAGQCTNFNRLNTGLPVLLLTNGALRGVPEDDQQLIGFITSKLGVQPRN